MRGNLVRIFFETAEKNANNLAIKQGQQSISYQQLRTNIESTAAWLESRGIKEDSKVLVFVPMSIKLYEIVLALFCVGATVVFVDEWADRKRLKKALQVVPIDAVIAPPKFIWLAYILNPFRSIPLKLSVPRKLKPESYSFKDLDLNKTALITFTTGSTGLPKAANRTHHFLTEQFRILKEEIGAQDSDRCLVTLPIVLLSILGTGASAFVADFNQKKPEKLDSLQQAKLIREEEISLLIASPYYVEKLTEQPFSASNIKKIITGGAPVFPELAKKIDLSFPNSENLVAYGSTEAEPIATINMSTLKAQENLHVDGLLVGEKHPEIEIKVLKISTEEISLDNRKWKDWELGDGEIGEIVVAGPHVLTSYYNSEEAFRLNKIVDGNTIWHRTGDSGKISDGKLYLSGRSSQLRKIDGEYVSPFVMEYLLIQIDDVSMGTFLEINGKFYVIVESQLTDKKHLRIEIERIFKGEFELKIVDKIPRDPRHFSKIDYKLLESRIS